MAASPKASSCSSTQSQRLAGLGEFIGKSLSPRSEAARGQQQYDIIPL